MKTLKQKLRMHKMRNVKLLWRKLKIYNKSAVAFGPAVKYQVISTFCRTEDLKINSRN